MTKQSQNACKDEYQTATLIQQAAIAQKYNENITA